MQAGRIRGSVRRVRTAIAGDLKKHAALYAMLCIPFAILILFKYVPMYGIQIAFRDFRISRTITQSPWAGLKYIEKFVHNYLFWPVLRNTLAINLYSLATFPLSLLFALMLHYLPFRRMRKSVQMISYAPHFISVVVLCGMVIQFLNARGGMFNAALGLLGIPPQNYMAKPEYFYSIYVWSGVWQELGYSSIIFIAALAGISPELHEAAIIDGATILKRIRHVDVPGVMPTFSILLIMRIGSLMNIGFEKVLLLQNNLNKNVSEVISTYAYAIGINTATPQYSYSAAISLFTAVINLMLLYSFNRISRKLSGHSIW